MDPDKERITDQDQSTAGAATAAGRLPADKTDSKRFESGEDPSHTEEVTPGAFGPLRYYVNQKLRNRGEVTVPHGEGAPWIVQELTMEGQLRIANPAGDDYALVPLDERYIAGFFAQIL